MSASITITVNLDHAESLAAYTAAGHPYPAIPAGKNTVWHRIVTTDGKPALLANQRGFARRLSDDEEEVNGCTLLVANDAPDAESGYAALERFVLEMLHE